MKLRQLVRIVLIMIMLGLSSCGFVKREKEKNIKIERETTELFGSLITGKSQEITIKNYPTNENLFKISLSNHIITLKKSFPSKSAQWIYFFVFSVILTVIAPVSIFFFVKDKSPWLTSRSDRWFVIFPILLWIITGIFLADFSANLIINKLGFYQILHIDKSKKVMHIQYQLLENKLDFLSKSYKLVDPKFEHTECKALFSSLSFNFVDSKKTNIILCDYPFFANQEGEALHCGQAKALSRELNQWLSIH